MEATLGQTISPAKRSLLFAIQPKEHGPSWRLSPRIHDDHPNAFERRQLDLPPGDTIRSAALGQAVGLCKAVSPRRIHGQRTPAGTQDARLRQVAVFCVLPASLRELT